MAHTPLTADEIDRLEWLLGTIEAKRLVSEPLTEDEARLAAALEELTQAERAARNAFSGFYTALPAPGAAMVNDPEHTPLPLDVAACISRWVEARRVWDALATEFLDDSAPSLLPMRPSARIGPRLRARLPKTLRIPATLTAREMLTLLFAPSQWSADADGLAVTARQGETHLRLELDDATGLSPDAAIRQIAKHGAAKHGASVAQTFFALIALWMERNPEASPETYLTVSASDLLRYQHRKETPRGGYHSDDILAKGRDIYLLSRISIPVASVRSVDGGKREARTLALGRLLSLESLEFTQVGPAQDSPSDETNHQAGYASIVQFRYHLGREVFRWVGGEQARYALLSGKLLTYHPVRQKYQILFGFCLAYYDRVSRRSPEDIRRLSLPALLNLAAIPVPDKRIAEFLSSIEEALEDLSRDGVIPGLKLQKPPNWTDLLAKRRTRDIIAGSVVTFPRRDRDGLPAPLNPIAALPAPSVSTDRAESKSKNEVKG
jgi:hypothetical protein